MSLSVDVGPVAIVGASCLLPGADSLEAYWSLLMERRGQVGPLPEGTWRWERYTGSLPESQPPPRLGAALPAREIAWARYRVPPNERPLVHRQEGLLIEVVERALGSARLLESDMDRSRIGLICGSMGLGLSSPRIFTLRTRLQSVEQGLRQSLAFGRLDEATRARVERGFRARFDAHVDGTEGFPDVAAWVASGISMGRVCNALDLRGPHLSLDTGESSALAALEAAIRQLRQGDQDVMVVVAHAPVLNPVLLHQLAHMGWLGADPLRPFDEGAAGSVVGEGMGAVVLKRLADAVRDGDRIDGVIRGLAGGSQGRSRCAPTPDEPTLAAVLERTYAQAGYGLEAVDFIEAHGAGLPDWDAAELGALRRALGPARDRPVALGMVKALLGNQLAGAGMSGLLKVLLAMRHRTLPPEVPVRRPLELLRGAPGLEVRATPAPWAPRARGEPLRAGITALGMGGTHYHLTVESYEPAHHERLLASRPRPRLHEHFAVAVVGMGTVLPGAADVPAFLDKLRAQRSGIRDIPPERWSPGELARPFGDMRHPKDTGIIYLDKGGFISDSGEPRLPLAMPPRQVAAMDRSQRWLLEAAGQALGQRREAPVRTSVFVGHAPKCENEVAAEFYVLQADLTRLLSEALAEAGVPPEARAEMLSAAEAHALADFPPPSEDTLPGYQGCFHAGWVSAAVGGTGPGMAVDSACASSLAALELACRALREGECDRAVVAGTWANLTAEYYNMFSLFQALCRGERQDALGPEASGFIPGEGAGALVLKRLEEATRDGDHIHAVVRAVVGSSDGQGKALYAVNPQGLMEAVQRAVATAGVSPDSVSLVEAHATASPAGDVAELETYAQVYGHAGPVALSFLKGNVGHLNTAAGIAALVKTALALEHGRVLPSAGFSRLHPDASLGDSQLYVATAESAWPEVACRRAAVTSYGMGGTNYHAILDAPPAPKAAAPKAAAPKVAAPKVAAPEVAAPEATGELIAVIGADAHFASGAGLEAFWESAVAGRGGLRELPAERWRAVDYALGGAARVIRGGFLDGEALEFPWQKFRVPPLQARRMPPMDRLLFRTVHRALEHAGYGDVSRLPRTDTAILVGSMGPMMDPTAPELLGFRAHEVLEALESVDAVRALPGPRREAFFARVRELLAPRKADTAGDVSGSASIMAGRIANLLGLRGMHLGVDAEAASALVALEVAARGLLRGDFDVALVAALSPWLSPLVLEAYRQLVPDAPDFHLGEGGGAVVLKRLSDARRDGDRVLGVIRATGTASHGASCLPTSPSADTLERAMREALAQARWEPGSVGYLEGHACGVPDWDEAEREAVGRVFGEAVRFGSGKAAAGHTLAAAGMAGFLRALLAIERGRLPAQVGGTAGEWPRGPRRAGVTAWGLNGMACHVLLEEPPAESAFAPRPRPERQPLDVALVGLGGVFPQAPDVPSLWRNLLERRSAIGEVPAERWEPAPYFDPSPSTPGRIYSRLGAFVKQLPSGAQLEGLPPAARERADRSQAMAVAAAREALAGRGLGVEAERVGVVLADMDWRANEVGPTLWLAFLGLRRRLAGTLVELGLTHDEALAAVGQAVERFQARHAPITEDTLPGYLGSMAAARVSRATRAAGPSFVVESTCASSLASLYVAANLLRAGRCDVVLSGGVFANLTPEYYLVNCSFRALSPNGIRPFDYRADGFVPGEGAGVLVLKRLEDAERDGDTIHAVVRGIGGSSDGGGTILAPNASGQALAVRRALEQARVPGASVRYVECHGAGTALGDLTELEAYAEAYGERERPLGLTSVKSAIGHLASAAGVAGVVKTALALRHGVLPPSLGYERPNDSPHLASGRFEVFTEARPWEDGGVRRAGVSGFGLGGTNFHVVLEEYRQEVLAPAAPVQAPREQSAGEARLSPGRLAWLLIQGARQQFPGRAVQALEDLRLIEAEPSTVPGSAPVAEAVPVSELAGSGLRVSVRVVDSARREWLHAQGLVVLETVGSVAGEGGLGACSAEELERALGATSPSATAEWRLLGVRRLAPSAEAPSLQCLRLGREARVHAVVASPRVRVEEALWWSPPPRWRETRFLESGQLRHPSDYPLADRRLAAGEASLEVLRDVSLEREPYLEDHRLEGTPVVPGAVHVEALAEGVALLWPDVGVKEIHGFSVPMAAKLDGRAALPLRTVVQGARPRVEARLLSDFVDGRGRTLVKDRLHAQASFLLGEAPPPLALEDAGRVLPWLARGGSGMDTCYLDPDQTTLGPRFRSLQWLRVFGRSEVLARVERPAGELFGHTRAPRFLLDPFLLDGCFQAAAMLGVWHSKLASLPAGFEVLRLHGTPEEGQPLYVHARLLSASAERATYHIDAFDGRGRLYWRLQRYQEYLLFPLSTRGMEKLERLVGETRLETPLRAGGGGGA